MTGSAKGMRKAIATLFAREGASVAVAARQMSDAKATAGLIGEQARPVAIEVSVRPNGIKPLQRSTGSGAA
ncbi:MAG: hypothetical protein ABW128_16725 [Rhizorhabdus sp.]